MRKLANHAARDIASPAVKMGIRSLFPGVAVPLAFFCTLFFRHRKKSVSAPWDGQSQSAPESARQAPPKGNFLGRGFSLRSKQGGFPLAPCTPFGSPAETIECPMGRQVPIRAGVGASGPAGGGVCACGRTGGFPLAPSPLRIAT